MVFGGEVRGRHAGVVHADDREAHHQRAADACAQADRTASAGAWKAIHSAATEATIAITIDGANEQRVVVDRRRILIAAMPV